MNKLLYLTIYLALLVVVSLVECTIDESRVDLSMFKLRSVRDQQVASHDLMLTIDKLAHGARLMRGSLFANDFQVRCMTYAHLFKIINRSRDASAKSITNKPIHVHQDTIDALAVVADSDRAIYYDLFRKHRVDLQAKLFQEAIVELERDENQDSLTRDTWLELVRCASVYYPQVKSFLIQPERIRAIKDFETFKAIPLPENHLKWERGNIVSLKRLLNKFEHDPTGFTDEQDVERARDKVDLFDDAEAMNLRKQVQQQLDNGTRSESVKNHKPISNDENAYDEYIEQHQKRNELPEDVARARIRMAVLAFRRKRLEWIARMLLVHLEKPIQLDINTAFDYVGIWRELQDMRGQVKGEVGKEMEDFVNDPANLETANRMERATRHYTELLSLLDELKLYNGEIGRRAKSMEELDAKYDHILDLIEQFDKAFDNANMMRALKADLEKQKRKFNVLNDFIENKLW